MYTKETKFECPGCGTKLRIDENVETEVESYDDEHTVYDGVTLKCSFCSTHVSMPKDTYDKR